MKKTLITLLLLSLTLSACASAAIPEPGPDPTEAPIEEPVVSAVPLLEIVGATETLSLSITELMDLPVTEGYAGMKSSTGKITPPITFRGVAIKDLVGLVGGMDASTGFNVVAEDGYSITYSYDQITNGTFIAYDPATGDELKNPVDLTAILAYEMDGQPLDPKGDGIVRLVIISDTLNQVTDGHWAVKWVAKLVAKELGAEWNLKAHGALKEDIDRVSVESCGSPQCHSATWTDNKAQEWVGVPLWLLVGAVDDEIAHEGPAFNDALVETNYAVEVIASDGYSVPFDASRVARNDNIIVAFKVNENPLTDKYFPLRLVGSDLEKSEMAGGIVELKVDLEALSTVEELVDEAVVEETAEGSLVIVGLVDQALGFMEADLRAFDILKINADHPKNGAQDFEGVSLKSLLAMAGVQDGSTTLVITARDGYATEISLDEALACGNCLVGFTNTPEKLKMVMPDLPSNLWIKDVASLEVK